MHSSNCKGEMNKQFLKAVIKEAVAVLHAEQVASMETSKTEVVWGYEHLTSAMIYAAQPQDQKQVLGERFYKLGVPWPGG